MMSTTFERPAKSRRLEVPTASTRPAFITRHAVPTYYAIAFAISWIAILLAVGLDGWFGTGATIVVAGSVSLVGPSIAGVLMTDLADGRADFACSYLDCGGGGSGLVGMRWRSSLVRW